MAEECKNPFVGIAGAVGGISIAIVAIFAIFAPEQLKYSPYVVGALALMGIFMGFFALRKK